MAKPGRGRGANPKGRSRRGGQFVPLPYTMVDSEAFMSLSGAALRVYVLLHRRYNGTNNGDLSLSLEEGAKLLGLGKETVRRAFAELEEKGFIRKTRQGHFHGRMATTYAVTDREHGSKPPTNDWQKWRPPTAKKKFVDPSQNRKAPSSAHLRTEGDTPSTHLRTRQPDFAQSIGSETGHLYSSNQGGLEKRSKGERE